MELGYGVSGWFVGVVCFISVFMGFVSFDIYL